MKSADDRWMRLLRFIALHEITEADQPLRGIISINSLDKRSLKKRIYSARAKKAHQERACEVIA